MSDGTMTFIQEVVHNPMLDNITAHIINDVLQATLYVNVTLINMLLTSLTMQKYSPLTTTMFEREYDYIIVGAGSAGSTLANRLTEMPCVSVLLLEAGISPPMGTEVPAAELFRGTAIEWNYNTAPQRHTGSGLKNRSVRYPLGKVVGGSSVLNGMLYVRGNRRNFDDWAAQGARGWDYANVFHYFKKAENNQNPEFVDQGYHGFNGPLTVMQRRYWSELRIALREAARLLGLPLVDSNGRNQRGFYDFQSTMRDGQRCSTAKAYLSTADSRSNLDIVKEAFVTKILIDRKRAIGVQFDHMGRRQRAFARKEVIVSAGAVNSARLLMVSGIGPIEELEKFHIPVHADLPVGENFHDHCFAMMTYEMREVTPFQWKVANDAELTRYLIHRSGAYAAPYEQSGNALLTIDEAASDDELPDYEMFFAEAVVSGIKGLINIREDIYEKVFVPHFGESSFWCFSGVLNTRSRGTIKLRSNNPYDEPIIDPNYLADPEDLAALVAGMKKCNKFAQTEPMRRLGIRRWKEKNPDCEHYIQDTDEYLTCEARSILSTIYQPVGTAKMGSVYDPTTVVDEKLRVKGIRGLRVVDASIMPQITSGPTNAPVIMIGEKAADLIKEDIHCFS